MVTKGGMERSSESDSERLFAQRGRTDRRVRAPPIQSSAAGKVRISLENATVPEAVEECVMEQIIFPCHYRRSDI
ncbi:hypothetical protein AKJ43_03845 [candidate division MSBL1 archaeon SCGC-AAA261D19]|uniref:Uncharacterized protein n=1 Tax=candidate division MSBL1 archaeon SCGC-AAA261D19 TaxID=1698273 RepID=A0A133V3B9_9EURY|nr:hypothetical protein AKJ43_03845 [candidate division MSBL1 archaeon SCGC-AAA261D19]